ncbi:neurochondrin [Pholidichthys leucotaenia]
MSDSADATSAAVGQPVGKEEPDGGEGGARGDSGSNVGGDGLTGAQREVMERCIHALIHAPNDSHTVAALLVISRLCPAKQLDRPTARRIFEAVGFTLPARLLMTAIRRDENSGLDSPELLTLGTALLSAMVTEPDMALHPHLLSTIPVLLDILANGPESILQTREAQEPHGAEERQEAEVQSSGGSNLDSDYLSDSLREPETGVQKGDSGSEANSGLAPQQTSPHRSLYECLATDCYQVLTAICALPRGPDHLLSRGAIPALCQAVEQKRALSHDRGVALLASLVSGEKKDQVWSKHTPELLTLLFRLSKNFCVDIIMVKLEMCPTLVQLLPPAGVVVDSEELKRVVRCSWEGLRPLIQSKLTPKHIGQALVLAACLLDLHGWELAGPPKFCCLLVNRACVEVRMGLEELPGGDLNQELQNTITGCYRIMEAAIEQACSEGVAASQQPSTSSLSLQQSTQVLRVLEEAFSAVIYFLKQVDPSRYDDPFVFATFRSLCSWLAEETSCLREEVTALLPFLINYTRSHMQDGSSEQGLSDWMARMSVGKEREGWTGREPLRYLLPALCHLSSEEGPRQVLLRLQTPALLVDFLSQCWTLIKGKREAARDPSMETACSALLNFTITEPEAVRKEPSFRTLETLLNEALPVLLHKRHLLVLAANYCTLGIMMGRLKSDPSGSLEAGQRRFFSAALRFLGGALDRGSSPGPVKLSPSWEESWDEAAELWKLSLQALGGCARAQPAVATLAREEGWLKETLTTLGQCSALPDQHTKEVLEQALCDVAESCPVCKREIRDVMVRHDGEALSSMMNLKVMVGLK